MKILLITDLYPIKRGDENSPLTLHNFAFEWIRQGHQVDVIKPNFLFNSFVRKKPFYKTGFYDYEGIKIFNVNYFTPFLFDVTKKLPEAIEISQYDRIVAHMPSGIIFADKLAKKFDKPLICGVHTSDIEVMTNPLYKKYFKEALQSAYKNARKIACRSFVIQRKFSEIFPEFAQKTFAAPSGIDEKFIIDKELNFSKPIKALTCANLIERKNIDKLILAINDLEGFELNIIGKGKELKSLKKMAGKKVNFLGKLPHEKVLEEMKKSDIFVLPSVNETFGMVYLEAMASGCITVGTKEDGVDGIIVDEKNGFLTEPNSDKIKETLLKIQNWYEEGAKKAHFFGAPTLGKILENANATVKIYTNINCALNYTENIK